MDWQRPKDWHPTKVGEARMGGPIAEWITSNPTSNPFDHSSPTIIVCYDHGTFRWPVVPEPAFSPEE